MCQIVCRKTMSSNTVWTTTWWQVLLCHRNIKDVIILHIHGTRMTLCTVPECSTLSSCWQSSSYTMDVILNVEALGRCYSCAGYSTARQVRYLQQEAEGVGVMSWFCLPDLWGMFWNCYQKHTQNTRPQSQFQNNHICPTVNIKSCVKLNFIWTSGCG